jgi:hypothetical protein
MYLFICDEYVYAMRDLVCKQKNETSHEYIIESNKFYDWVLIEYFEVELELKVEREFKFKFKILNKSMID